MRKVCNQILVIDDCEDVLFLLSLKLKRLGYRVQVAKDGEDAFAILKQCNEVGLILIDLMMPKYSGIDFLKEIKKDTTKRDISILCITASRDNSLLSDAHQIGVDGILTKPIKNNILKKEIYPYLPPLAS
jgi:CheY-like chemotaxis protein